MSQTIFRRLTLAVFVGVAVIVDPHQSTCRDDERLVERIEEAAEVVHALLNRQNDAVEHNHVILGKTKMPNSS